jgi:uncharacterized cupredoxin-like copper-binding protein
MLKIALTSMVVIAGLVGAAAVSSANTSSAVLNVTESEMNVTVSTHRVAAGRVTFVVRNTGTVVHELVVMRWSGNAKQMPRKGYQVSERSAVGEVADVEPGHVGRATLTLKPGKYVLVCNIPGHYQLGMSTYLTAA